MANYTVPYGQLVDDRLWGSVPMLRWMSDAAKALRRVGVPLFDHYGDAGNTTTGETDLYSDSLFPGQLLTNGDKITATYVVTYAANANTKRTRVYFGGTAILDTTALARNNAAAQDRIDVTVIRESATVVRCVASILAHNGSGTLVANPSTYTRITSLTLTNAQILKLTGQSSSATNDIVAKMGAVSYTPAA